MIVFILGTYGTEEYRKLFGHATYSLLQSLLQARPEERHQEATLRSCLMALLVLALYS